MSVTVASRTTVKGQTSVGGFSPASLFLNNEQGVWYDPSDMTTMFQDFAGTTPVTAVEQPVGLLLDKSKGLVLGSELVTNGDFSNGTTAWDNITATLTVSNGVGTVTSAGNNGYVRQTVTTVVGKTYQVTCVARNGTSGFAILSIGNGGLQLSTSSTTDTVLRGVFTAVATSTNIWMQVSTAGIIYFKNISFKELPGNHATQSTNANRPVLSARVNLATYSQSLATGSAWPVGGSSLTLTNNAAADPYGGNAATLAVETTATNIHFIEQTVNNAVANLTYTMSCFFKKGTRRYVYLCHGTSTTTFCGAVFDLDTATAITVAQSSGFAASNATIVSVGNGWYRCSVDISQPSNIAYIDIGFRATAYTSGSIYESYTGSTSENGYWFGADLRVTNQGVNLPVYQRVGAATYGTSTTAGVGDYDTNGFPYYLKFDGSNDYLSTVNINFTTTNKACVFAGINKNSDSTSSGIIAELTADVNYNPGSFNLRAPANAGTGKSVGTFSCGTTLQGTVSPDIYGAPIPLVCSSLFDIASPSVTLRINGSQVSQDTNNQGTGNYSNSALYIGSRGGSSVFFNGNIYGLIIRGASSNALQIAGAENWLNQKTKAYA